MKGRLVALAGVFCIAILLVSAAYADKPENKGKPPGPIKLEKELIVFTGDLVGGEVVEGCCLNRGPNPPYTMTVAHDLGVSPGPVVPAGEYEGFIFMNVFGTRKNQQYYVKFWGTQQEEPISTAFGIKGGIIDHDKKSGVLFVDFTGDDLYTLDSKGAMDRYIDTVIFTLTRTEL